MADTKETIMSVARSVAQAHGFGGLSFRELAKEVGIKSASIHYHFPTKGDLATELARQYAEETSASLEAVFDEATDTGTRMKRYVALFRKALENDNRMCLCGFLAAEYEDVPETVRAQIQSFADINVAWLARVLAEEGAAASPETHRKRAMAIFAAIGGAQLTARGRCDITMYDQIVASYQELGLIPG